MKDFETGLTQERLKKFWHYDPETGIWTGLVSVARHKAGRIASGRRLGYLIITVDQRRYEASRLAFLYMLGRWPKSGEVDHRDLDPTNDRWSNLREASRIQNSQNKKKYKRRLPPSSQFKGVCWSKQKQKFWARITVDKKKLHLGFFDDDAEAGAAYAAASAKFHGNFARTA